VTVIAGRPNFVSDQRGAWLIRREAYQNVRILRVRNVRFKKVAILGRAFGLLSYVLLAVWAALCERRPDVIVVETDPPVLGLVGALLRRWHRCRLVFYLQDLYPEVGLALGRLRPGLITHILHTATQAGLHNSDRVVVLGEDMRRRVLRRGIKPNKIAVVPNWSDTRLIRPTNGESQLRLHWELAGRFAVMYSGNLGLSQNLTVVLEVAERMREEAVTFLLIGDGGAKAKLMAHAAERKLDNVRFLPYQPKERLTESLTAADVHLIPLQKGLAGCIVPSKLYGILAAGKPFIAAVEQDSEVATITDEARCGLRVEPDDADALLGAVRWCMNHRQELQAMGLRGRELAVKRFDRAGSTTAFEQLLESLPRQ
jgi:colanic acid biosynthesis glycosyl transferase WcaI